jgi:hypothetical protein
MTAGSDMHEWRYTLSENEPGSWVTFKMGTEALKWVLGYSAEDEAEKILETEIAIELAKKMRATLIDNELVDEIIQRLPENNEMDLVVKDCIKSLRAQAEYESVLIKPVRL